MVKRWNSQLVGQSVGRLFRFFYVFGFVLFIRLCFVCSVLICFVSVLFRLVGQRLVRCLWCECESKKEMRILLGIQLKSGQKSMRLYSHFEFGNALSCNPEPKISRKPPLRNSPVAQTTFCRWLSRSGAVT